MELTSRGKNNFKNFLEFSMISNTTVSVSSSGKNGSIRTSLSYLYDKNQYPNSRKNKFWYNIGGELKLGNKASVEGSMNLRRNLRRIRLGMDMVPDICTIFYYGLVRSMICGITRIIGLSQMKSKIGIIRIGMIILILRLMRRLSR